MPFTHTLYSVVTGAATACRAADPLPDLLLVAERVITVPTPHALQLVSPLTLARASVDTRRAWGVRVIEPWDDGSGLTMAPAGAILDALAE